MGIVCFRYVFLWLLMAREKDRNMQHYWYKQFFDCYTLSSVEISRYNGIESIIINKMIPIYKSIKLNSTSAFDRKIEKCVDISYFTSFIQYSVW
jgi:hypothetical protein